MFSVVVEEATVASGLPPARGLLLWPGADMLKKPTITFEHISCINYVWLIIMSLNNWLVSVFPVASYLALSRPLSDRVSRTGRTGAESGAAKWPGAAPGGKRGGQTDNSGKTE